MDRIERILDLVALLLDARSPVSFDEIREFFPGEYSGSEEAALRKFERDKAELVELGIPISFVKAEEGHETKAEFGYIVDRDAYYLPEVKFTPEELVVLYSAGAAALASGAFPGQEDLAYALRKIAFFSEAPMPAAKVRVDLDTIPHAQANVSERLDLLWRAIENHKRVAISYFSPHTHQTTERTVRPYGLALRRGVWTLVGHCELRNDIRTFIVHRIQSLTPAAGKSRAPDFEVPKDFVLSEYVATWPWQNRIHAPVEVTIQLTGTLVAQASRLFPVPADPTSGETRVVTVKATDVQGLLRYVISLGTDATVTGPESAVTARRELLHRIAAAHGATA